MRNLRFALLPAALALLARCSASTTELAPLEWQKVPGTGPGGAVLGFGAPGTFDERGNFTISAFKEGGVFKLYYGGADATGTCAGPNGSHWRIGLATSTDGVNWTRVPGTETGGAILDIGRYPEGRRIFMPEGSLLSPGAILRQVEAARTLERLAEEGNAYFYHGEFAKEYSQTTADLRASAVKEQAVVRAEVSAASVVHATDDTQLGPVRALQAALAPSGGRAASRLARLSAA